MYHFGFSVVAVGCSFDYKQATGSLQVEAVVSFAFVAMVANSAVAVVEYLLAFDFVVDENIVADIDIRRRWDGIVVPAAAGIDLADERLKFDFKFVLNRIKV
jgi:hypothetical protein